jgi:hypothetical protein
VLATVERGEFTKRRIGPDGRDTEGTGAPDLEDAMLAPVSTIKRARRPFTIASSNILFNEL